MIIVMIIIIMMMIIKKNVSATVGESFVPQRVRVAK